MDLWESISSELTKNQGDTLVDTILKKVNFKQIENGNTIVLTTPDEFIEGWFKEHYADMALSVCKELTGKSYKFKMTVVEPSDTVEKEENLEFEPEKSPQTTQKEEKKVIHSPYLEYLNSSYTFENFITGPNNEFAMAAAQNIVADPGSLYNPFFVYGHVALGKTHLIQSIAHALLEKDENLKVLYVTSETFTNDFIEQIITQKKHQLFRNKYRNIDVLIIDDIQFFEGKESTLEEFFNTFNTLLQNGKQLIFACDKAPKQLIHIEERLRSRFESGLTIHLSTPEFETRKGILQHYSKRLSSNVPSSVIDYIAENINENIRVLEGSLKKVIAYCELKKKDISLTLAKEILRDRIQCDVPVNLSVIDIQKETCHYFNISVTDVKSKKRNALVSHTRQIAMYICVEYTSLSLAEIGQLFGGKNHSTVTRSHKKIKLEMESRKKIKREVEDILYSLANN